MAVKVKKQLYRIRMKMEVWRKGSLVYQNTGMVSETWDYVQVQAAIEKELRRHLKKSYFRCQDKDFDLVRYQEEGSLRTYMRLDPWPKVDVVV